VFAGISTFRGRLIARFKYIYLLSTVYDYLVGRRSREEGLWKVRGLRRCWTCPINKPGVNKVEGWCARSTFTLLNRNHTSHGVLTTRVSGSHGIHLLDKCTYTYVCVSFSCACVYVYVYMCVYVYIYIYNLCTRTTVTITTTAIVIMRSSHTEKKKLLTWLNFFSIYVFKLKT
jgi:hypothetical protein